MASPRAFPWLVRCRYLPFSRRCAFQDRARVPGSARACQAAQGGPDRRGVLVGPGRLDQRGADRLQPALVMLPRRVRSPEEYSDGTSPV